MAASRPFDRQSDDTLAHVLSFLDYESTAVFSKHTFEPLTARFSSDSFVHVWRQIYARHLFSPIQEESPSTNYMQECKNRRDLVKNLVGAPKTTIPRHCFNLPNRFFSFVPIVPTDNDDDFLDLDPPPTDFHCESFVLTCPGTSGELLLLDPFDMSLSIHASCTDNAVASDEAMMAKAMLHTASALVGRQRLVTNNERDEHVAGTVIEDTGYRNHNVQDYQTPPSQVLIDSDDYFNVNLAEYFVYTQDRHARRRTRQGHLLLHPQDEVDFGYVGVEAKPIVGKNGELEGTMVGLGRFLSSFGVDGAEPEESISVTEIVTWRKFKGESEYGNVRICRVPYDIFCADTCSRNNRIYVVFYRGQGPSLSRVEDDDDDTLDMDDTNSSTPIGRKTVVAYPLMPADATQEVTSPRFFPKPEFSITCSDYVSYVTVDCTGSLLVGTNNGTIEVWKPTGASGMSRVVLMKAREAVIASTKRLKAEMEDLAKSQVEIAAMEDQDEDNAPVHIENDGDEDQFPRMLGSPTIVSFHLPSHLSIQTCGFVSMQYSRTEGTSLLLWKQIGTSTSSDFQVVSQLNLPLSPRRKPRVHYDGRRIVVLGEDHIGVIIMVNHVFRSNEDIDYFALSTKAKMGDDSGGLYNYTVRPHVRFANRIRHAALGGLERYEDMYMTCNERFIIVNTKTGNLGGGASSTGDGLLVIDLEEH